MNTTIGVAEMPKDNSEWDDETKLTISVPEAGALLGLSRNGSYAAADRDEIPTIRFGKLRRVPKVALRKKLQDVGAL